MPSEAEMPSESDAFVCRTADDDPQALLLQLCAATDRGQMASADEKETLRLLVAKLEARQGEAPALQKGVLDGRWKLVYSGVPAYRSSPFFWAFSKVCDGITTPFSPVPGDNSFASATYAITDGIPFQRVGVARQTLSASGDAALGKGACPAPLRCPLPQPPGSAHVLLLPARLARLRSALSQLPLPCPGSLGTQPAAPTLFRQSRHSASSPYLVQALSCPRLS